MARYINPFTDFGFKKLFGSQQAKPWLISMLNSLLELEDPIVDLRYENVEKFGISPDDRNAIFDLYCTTESDSHIIVEMQNTRQRYFKDRSLYYSTFPIAESARSGDWDFRLPPVYFLAFLNFRMPDYADSPAFKHTAMLLDADTKNVFYDKLKFVYLEMPKFDKEEHELEEVSDEWMYVIKNLGTLEELPTSIQREKFEEFFKMAEISAMARDERKAYELSLKHMRDYNNGLAFAREQGIELGREQGREEGMAIGEKKGREEGIQIGIMKIAKRMKEAGSPDDEIAEFTGLDIDAIRNL